VRTPLSILVALLALFTAAPAQVAADGSDLDAFMRQVLARRDENWKKLQQYILNEDETFKITGPNGAPLYGMTREYEWFPRDGIFVRSPLRANGATVSEADRRKAEDAWLRREQNREKQRVAPAQKTQDANGEADVDVQVQTDEVPGLDDLVTPTAQPRFVDSAYFMKFRFDAGSYALVGRERLLGRDVLRIEYYPKHYFSDPPDKKKPQDKKDDRIDQQMDKVALVTLWIEPTEHQILQYDFRNIDFDFLPGRSLARLDRLQALMRMGQPFPDVWLPDTIAMRFGMTLAIGDVAARYDVHYRDYRLATVTTQIR
jgi:hypothetical protein